MVLSTDVITGFPGERDEDHRATVELLEVIRPEVVNVTRFSPRPGTPAAKAKNQVPGWRSKERSRELTRLRFAIAKEVHEAMVGMEEEVMITEVGKPGTMIGRTPSYRPVVVAKKVPLGSSHRVVITRAEPTHLLGDIL
jgi:tRNA A37 methylthiotransferase MiaB